MVTFGLQIPIDNSYGLSHRPPHSIPQYPGDACGVLGSADLASIGQTSAVLNNTNTRPSTTFLLTVFLALHFHTVVCYIIFTYSLNQPIQ